MSTHTLIRPQGADNVAALSAFLASGVAAGLDPVTRIYLEFARRCEDERIEDMERLCDEIEATCPAPCAPQTLTGRLITLEGVDGSGKTTQARLLSTALAERGVKALGARALGGPSPAALALRAFILNPDYTWDSLAEGLLTISIYREALAGHIVPALRDGTVVVCDRLVDTLFVYLTDEARGLGQYAYQRLFDILLTDLAPGLMPDLTFLLDLSFADATARRDARSQGRLDRNEDKGDVFHQSVFVRYRKLAMQTARMAVIDATCPEADVTQAMLNEMARRFPELRGALA